MSSASDAHAPDAAAADPPQLTFATPAKWRAWLQRNHDSAHRGIWLKIARKGVDIASVTYAQALDEALCFGWIDGQRRSFDDEWYLQKFTPRRKRSMWSQVNVGHVARLTAEGRMHAAGLREVAAAQADGRWDAAYGSQGSGDVPPELAAALARSPAARRRFDELDSRNRYSMCFRVQTAKRPETRTRRAAEFIAMLERGETIH